MQEMHDIMGSKLKNKLAWPPLQKEDEALTQPSACTGEFKFEFKPSACTEGGEKEHALPPGESG